MINFRIYFSYFINHHLSGTSQASFLFLPSFNQSQYHNTIYHYQLPLSLSLFSCTTILLLSLLLTSFSISAPPPLWISECCGISLHLILLILFNSCGNFKSPSFGYSITHHLSGSSSSQNQVDHYYKNISGSSFILWDSRGVRRLLKNADRKSLSSDYPERRPEFQARSQSIIIYWPRLCWVAREDYYYFLSNFHLSTTLSLQYIAR